ncbi:Dyp-type peroxidase [Paraburkholderia acidisoli]|uniref:Dyp-type peroxidase n=2 Tax=Paraburkholderia acidisoli TaxID=2571748 RepID=A0A7Z2JIK1_9BURK|nr:Dyp-type peroxidase [Paraburkholderia acidisoli]
MGGSLNSPTSPNSAAHAAIDTEPQSIDAPLSAAAAFLVLALKTDSASLATAQAVVGSTDDLVKDIRIRTRNGLFTCNVGISHHGWGPLTGKPLPKELAPFREVRGAKHTAVSTAGDLLYHVRAESMDVIVEFEKILLENFGAAVEVIDDVAGFRYFDGRDLLEFVDGTANPDGLDLPAATLVGDEDAAYAGGSYVVIQKYLHDMAAWRAQSVEAQEAIIGRKKFDNTELPDAAEGQKSHKTLCTIEDAEGEHDILRDNMPFATPGRNEYGTYFIGYSRHLWVIEKMLERMFIGDPPPLHDRILDFSKAVTGVTFFAPPRKLLSDLGG